MLRLCVEAQFAGQHSRSRKTVSTDWQSCSQMRSCFLLESKRPLQVWLAAYSRRTRPQLRLEASSAGPDRSINGQQFLRQHHFFPWSRPPYRLLQLPASALVKDPFLRDRGDSPYPAAPLDGRPCHTSLTYFCNFPSRCRTPSILPASPSDNRASAIGLLFGSHDDGAKNG